MSKEIAVIGKNGAYELADDTRRMIKENFCKNLSDAEIDMFLHVCKRTGLDPVMKQIYAVKRKDHKLGVDVLTIQTAIDGFRLVAERTERYTPGREPTYCYDKDGRLLSATSYIKKMTKDGTWHEIAATAFYDEYVQVSKDYKTGVVGPTAFWKKMGHNQLAKCAEALALRKGFPMELSRLYTVDEMGQSLNPSDLDVSESVTVETQKELPKNGEFEFETEKMFAVFMKDKKMQEVELIRAFLERAAWHYKKTLPQTIEEYFDVEKFDLDFKKWKDKHYPEIGAAPVQPIAIAV